MQKVSYINYEPIAPYFKEYNSRNYFLQMSKGENTNSQLSRKY